MVNRSRSRSKLRNNVGTYKQKVVGNWVTVTRSATVGKTETCDDTINQWESDNGLIVVKKWTDAFRLTGSYTTGQPGDPPNRLFDNFPVGMSAQAPYDPRSAFPAIDLIAAAAEAGARTNPNVPSVNIPAFLGEARELPGLLRSLPELLHFRGRGLIGHVPSWMRDPISDKPFRDLLGSMGDANLAWRFGWRPLLADLLGLADFASAVSQRMGWLNQLLNGRPIKRRHRLPNGESLTDRGLKTTHSEGCIVRHRMKTRYRRKHWITVRWGLRDTGYVLPKDINDKLWLAYRLAFGISSYGAFAAAWELLPWSWFVDWFFGVGNFIAAHSNTIPLAIRSMCYMRTTNSHTLYDLDTPPPVGVRLVGEFYQEMEVKERTPLPTFFGLLPSIPSAPAISAGQWGILGSLFVGGHGRPFIGMGGKIR